VVAPFGNTFVSGTCLTQCELRSESKESLNILIEGINSLERCFCKFAGGCSTRAKGLGDLNQVQIKQVGHVDIAPGL
jgi:hypothetical protein